MSSPSGDTNVENPQSQDEGLRALEEFSEIASDAGTKSDAQKMLSTFMDLLAAVGKEVSNTNRKAAACEPLYSAFQSSSPVEPWPGHEGLLPGDKTLFSWNQLNFKEMDECAKSDLKSFFPLPNYIDGILKIPEMSREEQLVFYYPGNPNSLIHKTYTQERQKCELIREYSIHLASSFCAVTQLDSSSEGFKVMLPIVTKAWKLNVQKARHAAYSLRTSYLRVYDLQFSLQLFNNYKVEKWPSDSLLPADMIALAKSELNNKRSAKQRKAKNQEALLAAAKLQTNNPKSAKHNTGKKPAQKASKQSNNAEKDFPEVAKA